ncbi:SET domain-containing protein SmydA-8, isoform A [Gryllus bimaculatus]|nr:SET domain-containing protein SmydA-8, isoform A [Gryllus bimaculatus]
MRDKGFRANLAFTPGKKEAAFCAIVPLRCLLLKERDPAKYQSLMAMESHLNERRKTPLYSVYKHNIVGFIRNVLQLTQFDEETILTIAAILDTNCFEIRKGGSKARGVYPTAALMAHDCTPNTKHVFKGSDFTIKIIATSPIKKGDIISTSYTQALWGTIARRAHLKMSKCFDCVCRRCADPTEFGTYIGAISCSKCKSSGNGILDPDNESKMISTDPLDPAAPWKCESCEHTIPGRQMAWGNDAMKQELDAVDVSRPEALENFVEKYISALHPKNSFIVQAKYALSQIYGNGAGYELPELPEHLLNRKIELCHELLELADALSPGMSTFRGLLLYDLQAAMVVQAKRDFENDKITKQNAQDIMGDAMKLLQEASEILRQDPDMTDELQSKMTNLAKELELD